ncbi:hypothetical protein Tco_1223454 [Tanacetum coccineum]
MYKEYLAEFWYSTKALKNSKVSFSIPIGGIYGEVGVNTFRNAIGANYIPHSAEYVAPLSIDIVRPWFKTIGYGKTVPAKGTLKKSLLPPSQEATKGGSSKAPIGSKTGHLKRKKDSSSTRFASEERAYPQLSSGMSAFNLNKPIYSASFIIHSESASGNDALADSTAEVDLGKSAPSIDPHVLANQTQSISEGLETVLTQSTTDKGANNIAKQIKEMEASTTIKLEDLVKLVQNVQPSFKDLDSPEDDPIIVVDDSDEDEEADNHGLHATSNIKTKDASVPKSSSPMSSQIQELTNHELPAEFLSMPTQVETVQAKLKTLDALPSLLNKVTNALNHFAQAIALKKNEDAKNESTNSDSDDDETHLTGSMVESSKIKKVKTFDFVTEGRKHLTEEQINQQKKIEEDAKAKIAKRESGVRKEELVDILGTEVVNKRAESRITNCDVLTKKGLILLKVYKENGTSEVISNFKASDLHLGEWREVINACPNNTDLRDFSNTMLYTIQEIFFRRHQGPWLNDHVRTFSALLLAEIDKRNLNPLKQMRTIKKLRQ